MKTARAVDGGRWRSVLGGVSVELITCTLLRYFQRIHEAYQLNWYTTGAGPTAAGEALAVPEELREAWAERVAIMVADGDIPRVEAERLAWERLQAQRAPGDA